MLRGEKIILRPKRLGDAPKDYAWRCDPELARLDAAQPLTIPFKEFLALYAEDLYFPGPGQHRYAIEDLEGNHIGNCVHFGIHPLRKESELGIMIGEKDHWDQGYGTDTVHTLLRYLFEEKKMDRVYLHTLDWNLRAQRCFAKSGFVPSGSTWREEKRFIIMEIRRSQWEEINQRHAKEKLANNEAV